MQSSWVSAVSPSIARSNLDSSLFQFCLFQQSFPVKVVKMYVSELIMNTSMTWTNIVKKEPRLLHSDMSTDHITVSTEKEKLVIPAAGAVDSVFLTAAESPVKTFLTSSGKTVYNCSRRFQPQMLLLCIDFCCFKPG